MTATFLEFPGQLRGRFALREALEAAKATKPIG